MSFLDDIAAFLDSPGGKLLTTGATTLGSILFTNSAADDLADAAAAAGAIETQYNNEAIQELGRQFNITRAELQPFLQAGTGATNELSRLLVEGGMMDPNVITQSPGYQFRLGEGMKAIDRAQSAGGYRLSGRGLKELERYAQDYASTEFDNYLTRLANLAGMGRSTGGDLANARGSLASNISSLLQASGRTQADSALTQGSADAGSTLTSGANILGLLASLTGQSPASLAAGLADLAGGGTTGAAPAAGPAGATAPAGTETAASPTSGVPDVPPGTGTALAATVPNGTVPLTNASGQVPVGADTPLMNALDPGLSGAVSPNPATVVSTPAQNVLAGVGAAGAGAGGTGSALSLAPTTDPAAIAGQLNAGTFSQFGGAGADAVAGGLSSVAPLTPLFGAAAGAFAHNLTAAPNTMDVFGRTYEDPMNMPFLDREGKPYWALIDLPVGNDPGQTRQVWVNRTGHNQLPDGTSVFVSPSELYNLNPEKRDAQGRVLGTTYADPYTTGAQITPTSGYTASPAAQQLLTGTPGSAAQVDLAQSRTVAQDPGARNVLSAMTNVPSGAAPYQDFIGRVNSANAGRSMGLTPQAMDLIQSQMPGYASAKDLTALGVAAPTWWDQALKFAPQRG